MRDIGMRDHTGRSMDACNPESLWDQLAAANQRAEQAEQRAAALLAVARGHLVTTCRSNLYGLDTMAVGCGYCHGYWEQGEPEAHRPACILAASGGAAPAVQAGGE